MPEMGHGAAPPGGNTGGMRRLTSASLGALAVLYVAFRKARARARAEDKEREARIEALRRRIESLERGR